MEALFIGHAYIDITFIADHLPTGDEKTIADDYAVAFGGNATTSAFCAAKLGLKPDLLCQQADDWLARMFLEMASRAGVSVHGRKVKQSSLSFIMPKDGKRAIVRCRDDEFIHPFPALNLTGCRGLHVDGHMADAAIHYAKAVPRDGRPHVAGRRLGPPHDRRAPPVHRRCGRVGADVRADAAQPARDARLSAQQGREGRRGHARRARPRLVRGRRRGPHHAGAPGAGGQGDRHVRRGRRVPRRLLHLGAHPPGPLVGGPLRVCAAPPRRSRCSASATKRRCPSIDDVAEIRATLKEAA